MEEWEERVRGRGSPTFDVNYLAADGDLYDPSENTFRDKYCSRTNSLRHVNGEFVIPDPLFIIILRCVS
jgi:hypothetical protein